MAELVEPAGVLAAPAGVAEFTDAWLANRRLSPHTRDAYRRDVARWVEWCRERGLDPLAARFTDVNAWGRQMEEEPDPAGRRAAPATVARRIAAVSSWYSFLLKLGAVPANPAASADRPSVDRDFSPTVSFTAADATRMLEVVSPRDRWLGPVAPLLAVWLIDMGTRVGETVAVDVEDLGHDSRHRTVRLKKMKGGRRRVRALPPAVVAQLDAYLRSRAAGAGVPVEDLTGPLFMDRRGLRVNEDQVARFVRRLARAAGVPDAARISPHSFRHAWNEMARQRGARLEDRQHALGHLDPRTTQRYGRRADALDSDPAYLVAAATTPRKDDT